MRNLITAAALFAAGTALANAAAVTDVLTTTFSDAGNSTVTGITVTNDPSTVSASVKGLTDGSSDLSQMTGTNTVVADTTIITPNANVGTGATWTLTLSYTIGSDSLTISSVTLDAVLFSSSGDVQSTVVTRYFDFTLTIADGSGSTVATYSVADIALTGTGAATASEAVLSGSEVTLAANTTYTVTLTAKQGSSNSSNGCYVGLSGITYTIPEPSAFGMIAGVGALALVAARRRRSRKAA